MRNPYATFSATVRWGRSANRWNTMETPKRRNSRSWPGLMARTSSPSMSTSPEVGSMSRLTWRMSVDLPDPDSPMITWTRRSGMSRSMFFSASTCPWRSSSSSFDIPATTRSVIAAALGPKILNRLLIRILAFDSFTVPVSRQVAFPCAYRCPRRSSTSCPPVSGSPVTGPAHASFDHGMPRARPVAPPESAGPGRAVDAGVTCAARPLCLGLSCKNMRRVE